MASRGSDQNRTRLTSRLAQIALVAAAVVAAPYENGVAGALCDDVTRERLRSIGESFDWGSLP